MSFIYFVRRVLKAESRNSFWKLLFSNVPRRIPRVERRERERAGVPEVLFTS